MENKLIISGFFVAFILISSLTVVAGPDLLTVPDEELPTVIELTAQQTNQLYSSLKNIEDDTIRKAIEQAFTNTITTSNSGGSVLDLTVLHREIQNFMGTPIGGALQEVGQQASQAQQTGGSQTNTYPLANIELNNGGSVLSPSGSGGLGWFGMEIPGVIGDLCFGIYTGITEEIMRETMDVKSMSGSLLETLEEGDQIYMGVFVGLVGFKLESYGPRMIMQGTVIDAETTEGVGGHFQDVWVSGWIKNKQGNPIRKARVISYNTNDPLCTEGWYCVNGDTLEEGTHWTIRAHKLPLYKEVDKEIDVSPGDTITDFDFVLSII